MKSRNVDEFNHDPWASGYDANVLDEGNPIRTGYKSLLDWVIRQSGITSEKEILELGSGTGNLTRLVPACRRILCVDVSEEMEKLAVSKVSHLKSREFIKSDVLRIFVDQIGTFDIVMSTYTIHHLTEFEKEKLFLEIWKVLKPGGKAVFGDLMFENDISKSKVLEELSSEGFRDIYEEVEDEFFWNIESSIASLASIGFRTRVDSFSKLSFGIVATKP